MAHAVSQQQRRYSGGSQASSMETVPTDFVDGYSSEEDGTAAASQSKVWGRLYPVGTSFTAIGRFGKLNGTIGLVPFQHVRYISHRLFA